MRRILVERFAFAGVRRSSDLDFHFGRGAGTPAPWSEAGRANRFTVDIVPAFSDDGHAHFLARSARRCAPGIEVNETAASAAWRYPVLQRTRCACEKRGRARLPDRRPARRSGLRGLKHGIYAVRVGLDGKRIDGARVPGRRADVRQSAPCCRRSSCSISKATFTGVDARRRLHPPDPAGAHFSVLLVDGLHPLDGRGLPASRGPRWAQAPKAFPLI